MDLDDYDEFGNYIGGKELADAHSAAEESESDGLSDASSGSSAGRFSTDLSSSSDAEEPPAGATALTAVDETHTQIIQSDATLYGEDVEMVVATEDNQQLSKPLLFDPTKTVTRLFAAENASVRIFREKALRLAAETGAFMKHIAAGLPERMRTVAVVGHSQHGKTSVCDCFLSERSDISENSKKSELSLHSPSRLLDTRRLERDRAMSMAAHPFSCVATASSASKRHFSFVLNGIDTPGHPNFADEALLGLATADAALLVVDAAEGVRVGTLRSLDAICAQNMPFVLFVNKIDRLILELHLPPADAHAKIAHIIAEVNSYIAEKICQTPKADPVKGNVVFGATKQRWFFSLGSIAALYNASAAMRRGQREKSGLTAEKLWGGWRYDADARRMHTSKDGPSESPLTFTAFALEPIYKICTAVLSNEPAELNALLSLAPPLREAELREPMPARLSICVQRFLRPQSALADAERCTIGALGTALFETAPVLPASQIFSAKAPESHTFATVTKFVQFPLQTRLEGDSLANSPAFEADLFYPLVRVLHGELAVGGEVHFAPADATETASLENVSERSRWTIDALFLIDPLEGLIHTRTAAAGALVALRGFTEAELRETFPFVGQGVLVGFPADSAMSANPTFPLRHIAMRFLPLQNLRRNECVVKVGVEPIHSEVDYGNFLYALRCASYAHGALQCTREETGERMLCSLGELRLDAVLFEMREVFGRSARENGHGGGFLSENAESVSREVGVLSVRVSDPFVKFSESILAESARDTKQAITRFGAQKDTRANRDWIRFAAAPMASSLQRGFANGSFFRASCENGADGVRAALRTDHGWDAFARSGFWGFGPHEHFGPNALVNETAIAESDSDDSDSEGSQSDSEDSQDAFPDRPKASEFSDNNSTELSANDSAEFPASNQIAVDSLRGAFLDGFRWATAEGPLCGEPVRNVTFNLTRALFPSVRPADVSEAGGLERALVPATRQCVTNCLLESAPCLLEPMFAYDIEATHAGRAVVYALVSRRRGKIMREERRPGSVLYSLTAEVPALDSFGLEVDLRVEGGGEVYAESRFSGWDVLPGGPATEVLGEIARHPSHAMASADVDTAPVAARRLTADVVLKVRRRKGMFAEG